MKIGVVLGSDTQSGGGFQHEMAIIENLKEHASNCGHKFYIFSYNFLFDEKKLKCDHLKFIKVTQDKAIKKLFISRLIDYTTLKIKQYLRNQHYQSIKTPIHKAIAEYNIELMYYPGPYGYSLTVDLPYVLTVWDLQHRVHPEFPEVSCNGVWKGRENLYQEAVGKAFAIIVDEEAGKEDVIRFYSVREEKVFVLPLVHPKINRAGDASLKSIQGKYKIQTDYIFYPAQFWPHKNHVAILKAVRILKEEYNTYISAVFTGSDKGNLSYIKKLTGDFGLTKQIFFLGFVPDEEIPALYKGALALVMPTYFGPSNIPVYEAFVYKCPVITSDIRGIREQVGDAGILVNPGDFRALSETIFKIQQDRTLREKLIINGTKKSQSWTGKDYIEHLIRIIDSFSSARSCWDIKYELK
jgi:glycosyltransferase involved in cell wall biosynthesis